MEVNQTSVCEIINTFEKCRSTESIDSGISNISPYFPLLGIIGPTLYFIIQNRPKITKKETSHYINAEANTRFHEYEFNIALGSQKLDWVYVSRFGLLKSVIISPTTRLEFFFNDTSGQEILLPENFIKKKTSKTHNEIFIKDIKNLRSDHIETIYLISRDEEKTEFQDKIKESFFPNDTKPSKIRVSNGNNLPIVNYKIILSKNQTKKIINKKKNFDKFILWNNKDVADCLIEDEKLIIIIRKIPKKSSGLEGVVTINLT